MPGDKKIERCTQCLRVTSTLFHCPSCRAEVCDTRDQCWFAWYVPDGRRPSPWRCADCDAEGDP